MKFAVTILILILPLQLFSQSLVKRFFKLSGPEKCWTLGHLFSAGRAFRITAEVKSEVKIQQEKGTIDRYINGGTCDAFRHCYWMALLSNSIGRKKAFKLGVAHERGNYKDYRRGRTEDEALPDSLSGVMDLYNNEQGLIIHDSVPVADKTFLIQSALNKLRTGQLKILLRSGEGVLSDCKGNPVIYRRAWYQPYCLVKSYVH